MLVDLHAHTPISGGKPLATLVDEAKAAGIDAICVADRDASAETARAVAEGNFDLPVFVGVEISTRSGDAIVITRGLDPAMTREEWRELNALERPELGEVIAWAEARDGVVLLAHPYDRNRRAAPRDRMYTLASVNGVEIGTDDADPTSNRVALEAVARSAKPAFGGSARGTDEGDGSWLTLFAQPVKTQDELVDAIASGDFWAVQVDRTAASDRKRHPPRENRDDRRGGGRRGGRDGGRDGGRSGGRGGRRDGGRGRR